MWFGGNIGGRKMTLEDFSSHNDSVICKQSFCRLLFADLLAIAATWRSFVCRNFTGNSISSIEKEAWREYPWAEHL